MKKNCMFQYATKYRIIHDTDLIGMDEAVDLFNKNKDDFVRRLENGEEPEMAVWINCSSNTSYADTSIHWCSDDMKIIDGQLYQRV